MISSNTSEHLQAIRNICSEGKCYELECGEVMGSKRRPAFFLGEGFFRTTPHCDKD